MRGENEEQYIWRLGQAKDAGIINLDWDTIADLVNKQFREDDIEYKEATYRKPYAGAKRYYEAGVFNISGTEDGRLQEIKQQLWELEKVKIQVRDERNELRRLQREEARKESYKDLIIRCISENTFQPLKYEDNKNHYQTNDTDIVVSFTDIHAGIEIENSWNCFNEEILLRRMHKYLDEIFTIQDRHKAQNVHVLLSELVSGIIHNELRIENNLDLIQQFLMIVNYLVEFLAELSKKFQAVHVYVAPGNHSRVSPKKEDSLKGENMDHLAIPYLRAALQNYKEIYFYENEVDESIAVFRIRKHLAYAVHGDKDEQRSVVQRLTMAIGVKPDFIFMAHRHTNGYNTFNDVKVIQSGCVSGPDNHSVDNRHTNQPEQTVTVISDRGLECIYDVTLN